MIANWQAVGACGEGHDAAKAREVFDAPPASAQEESARSIEEEGFHHRVVGEVQERGIVRQRRADGEDRGDLTDLRERRERQHALQLELEERADFAIDQCEAAQHHQHGAHIDALEREARQRAAPNTTKSTLTMPKSRPWSGCRTAGRKWTTALPGGRAAASFAPAQGPPSRRSPPRSRRRDCRTGSGAM